MTVFKRKYYIAALVFFMMAGFLAVPGGNVQAAGANDSFVQQIEKQYDALETKYTDLYEEDLARIQGDYAQFLQKMNEDRSKMEQLLDEDLKSLSEQLKKDYKELEAKYEDSPGYSSKLRKYESAIDPNYSSGALWKYNKEIDKNYSSSIHWKLYTQIDPNYSSGLMWKYETNLDPNYSSGLMWKYTNTMDPNYSSSLMWKLSNESDVNYSSGTMWKYETGSISLATAKERMAKVLDDGEKDLKDARDKYVGEITLLKNTTETSIIRLRDQSVEQLLLQRAESLKEISSIRESGFGQGITFEPLVIEFSPFPEKSAPPVPSGRINVVIDGEIMNFEQPPVMKNGSTLVPMRAIFERLGASLKYDAKTKMVTATKDAIKIELTLGSKAAKKNGAAMTLDVPGQLVGSHTMVPIRFISESLGATVKWDAAAQTVYITTTAAETEM